MDVSIRVGRHEIPMGLQRVADIQSWHVAVPRERPCAAVGHPQRHDEIVEPRLRALHFFSTGQRNSNHDGLGPSTCRCIAANGDSPGEPNLLQLAWIGILGGDTF